MTLVEVVRAIIYEGIEKFGRYYSSYRGFVADNKDPENMQRVLLKVPHLYGNNVHEYWAYPKNVYSGKDHGSQVIPSIGDMVWVSFEYGDPKRPVYSLGHFTKFQIPDSLASPNIFWFMTPAGQLVEMDDNKKEIRLSQDKDNQIILNKNGISLVTTKKLYMGNRNSSKEFGVLGETLRTELKKEQARSNAVALFLTGLGYPNSLPPGNFDNITTTKVKVE